jgi:radical SAM superfamily enzyme YgiQ (UPF0313 family)
VAALSTACRFRGHECALINVNDKLYPALKKDDAVIELAKSHAPEAIGFSIVTQQWDIAARLAQKLKAALGVPIIAGGVHVTMAPGEVMNEPAFDFAVLGEADEALPELLDALWFRRDPCGIKNVWARRGTEIVKNPVRPFPKAESIPSMDYGLFDFQHLTDSKDGWVGVMAGRGCPYRCTYCFNHALIERYRRETGLSASELGYVRFLPVERVIENLLDIVKKYKRVSTFIFDDDTFTFDRDYVQRFCRAYKQSRIGIPFVVNAHVRSFDSEIAKALKSAGCSVLKFGLESGNARVRKEVLRRPMSDGKIESSFAAAHEAGLHTSAFLMIGLPTETVEEMRDTVRMLGRIRPGRFRWSVFYPFPGTEAERIAREHGQINEKKLPALRNFMEASPLDFGEEHNFLIEKMNLAFPWFVNASSKLPAAAFYAEKAAALEAMNRGQFEEFKKNFRALDAEYSKKFRREGLEHYAVKYNPFMGVSSKFFLAEEGAPKAHEKHV